MHKPNNNLNIPCLNCKKIKSDIRMRGKAKGHCHVCYKQLFWKPKLVECRRCKRNRPMHAKGLCQGCYASVFHIEKVNQNNVRKLHNLDINIYNEITKSCILCGFDKIVDLHHIDRNHENTSRENLVGLCPNHHKMIHNRLYKLEIYNKLKEKGFKVPETYESDEIFKIEIPKTPKPKKEKPTKVIRQGVQKKIISKGSVKRKTASEIDLQKELEKLREDIKSGKFDL